MWKLKLTVYCQLYHFQENEAVDNLFVILNTVICTQSYVMYMTAQSTKLGSSQFSKLSAWKLFDTNTWKFEISWRVGNIKVFQSSVNPQEAAHKIKRGVKHFLLSTNYSIVFPFRLALDKLLILIACATLPVDNTLSSLATLNDSTAAAAVIFSFFP